MNLSNKQIERFWRKVSKLTDDHCWRWIGAARQDGYGTWAPDAKSNGLKPHRVAWILLRGQIPPKMTIDHLCMTKLCCNPNHLEVVTQSVNSKRYMATIQPKLFCNKGHAKEALKPCRKCNQDNAVKWRKANLERAHEISRASYQRIGKATRKARLEARRA